MKQRDLADRLFWMADENEIKDASTTDVYFINTKEVLAKNHIDSEVVMEVFARDLPYPGIWGVLTGVYEVAKLLEGVPVDVWSFDEGSIFLADAKTDVLRAGHDDNRKIPRLRRVREPPAGSDLLLDEHLHQGRSIQGSRRRQDA